MVEVEVEVAAGVVPGKGPDSQIEFKTGLEKAAESLHQKSIFIIKANGGIFSDG